MLDAIARPSPTAATIAVAGAAVGTIAMMFAPHVTVLRQPMPGQAAVQPPKQQKVQQTVVQSPKSPAGAPQTDPGPQVNSQQQSPPKIKILNARPIDDTPLAREQLLPAQKTLADAGFFKMPDGKDLHPATDHWLQQLARVHRMTKLTLATDTTRLLQLLSEARTRKTRLKGTVVPPGLPLAIVMLLSDQELTTLHSEIYAALLSSIPDDTQVRTRTATIAGSLYLISVQDLNGICRHVTLTVPLRPEQDIAYTACRLNGTWRAGDPA